MNKRPRSIAVISWIFIAFGCIALLAGLLPLVDEAASQRLAEFIAQRPVEFGLVWIARILAILSGAFVLYGFNWARWLLVIWMGYHVVLSALHSPLELFVHSLLFATILYFLFRPQASAYFRGTSAEPP